jgi:hypothetical protein
MQKLRVTRCSTPGFEVFTDISLLSHGIMLNGTTYVLCFILHIFWAINIYSQIYFQITALISNIKGDTVCFVHNTQPFLASTFYTKVIYSYHITQLLVNGKTQIEE